MPLVFVLGRIIPQALGGSALLGAAGTTSAESGDDGDPFAEEGHDHSGEYLGESEPVDRIDTGRVNATDELNNVVIVRPGDDIQAAIDSVYVPTPEKNASGARSGMVRFVPNRPNDQQIFEFPAPPYVVRPGVTLDMRGIAARFTADAKAMFALREGVDVLGHGAHFDEQRPAEFTGALWYANGDAEFRPSAGNPARIFGYPRLDVHVVEEGGHARPILLEQTLGRKREGANAAVGGCYFEVGPFNTKGIVRINSAGEGGWVTHNTVIANGSVSSGNAVEYESSGGVIRHNFFLANQIQVKGLVDRFLYCNSSAPGGGFSQNTTVGRVTADTNNVNVALAEWTEGVGPENPLLTTKSIARFAEVNENPLASTDNSERYGNYVGHQYKSGQKPFDLSQRQGYFHGERASDDGTNTTRLGIGCMWDEDAEVWVRPDGSTFSGR